MILFVGKDAMALMATEERYEQSSSEICHTGKSFFDARHTRSRAYSYLEFHRRRFKKIFHA